MPFLTTPLDGMDGALSVRGRNRASGIISFAILTPVALFRIRERPLVTPNYVSLLIELWWV